MRRGDTEQEQAGLVIAQIPINDVVVNELPCVIQNRTTTIELDTLDDMGTVSRDDIRASLDDLVRELLEHQCRSGAHIGSPSGCRRQREVSATSPTALRSTPSPSWDREPALTGTGGIADVHGTEGMVS
jgi:hypothetical protein